MSITYTDLTETLFPDALDAMTRISDLEVGEIVLANEYYRLYNNGNITAAKQLLQSNPQLQNKIFNAQNFNKIIDALVALERYFVACSFTQIDGEWISTKTYTLGNMISWNNALWQAQATNTNSTPSDTNPNWKKVLFIDTTNLELDEGVW